MINKDLYKYITDSLAEIIDAFGKTKVSADKISEDISLLFKAYTNPITQRRDEQVENILSPAESAAALLAKANSSPSNDVLLVSFTHALQSHVVKRFGDLNVFLDQENIKVKPSFATFSENLGYKIDSGNIE